VEKCERPRWCNLAATANVRSLPPRHGERRPETVVATVRGLLAVSQLRLHRIALCSYRSRSNLRCNLDNCGGASNLTGKVTLTMWPVGLL
jgi:hypothetical protein